MLRALRTANTGSDLSPPGGTVGETIVAAGETRVKAPRAPV
jgi:hypothetical protein